MIKLTPADFGITEPNPRSMIVIYLETLPEFKAEDIKEQVKLLLASAFNLYSASVIRQSGMDKILRNIRNLAVKVNV